MFNLYDYLLIIGNREVSGQLVSEYAKRLVSMIGLK